MEDDLTWLARTEHRWPKDAVYVSRHENAVEWHYVELSFIGYGYFTRDQWLARRAELQNKPSWKDAPEWAEFLSQDEDGEWKWLAGLPGKYVDGWTAVKIKGCCKGIALGDWRDTLERRPADLSEPAVTERLTEAAQTVLAAAPALMDEKYSFEPEFIPVSVSNETIQLERPIAVAGTGNGSATESAFLIGRVIDLLRTSVDHFSADELADLNELTGAELTKRDAAVCGGQKYIDAHWFERGELPPVGVVCEYTGSLEGSEFAPPAGTHVTVVAHHRFDHSAESVAVFAWFFHEENCGVYIGPSQCFRPIRTERQLTVDEMMAVAAANFGNLETCCEALYDAGYRKQISPAK